MTRLTFVFLLLAFRVSLDASYIFFVSPIFDYAGMSLHIDMVRVVESYVFLLMLAFLVPCEVHKPSDFLVTLLLLFPVLPTLAFYAMNAQSRGFMYMMVVSFLLVLAARRVPGLAIKTMQGGRVLAAVLALAMVTLVLGWLVARGGLGQITFALGNALYDFREESANVFYQGIFGYLNTWAFKVFNIALLAWGLYRKSPVIIVGSLSLQTLFFGILHQKAVLFMPVLVLGIFFCFKSRNVFRLILLGLLGIVGFSLLVAHLTDSILLPSLFIRRVFFLPAQLNFAYFDFFSHHGKVYMSNSVLSFLSSYPYAFQPANLIGNYVYGSSETNANTGFLATAYMHFGYPGMAVFSIIVGFLLRITDSLIGRRLPVWLGLAIVIVPFWSLFGNADLSTSLLTHGLLVSFLILWLFGARRLAPTDLFPVPALGRLAPDRGRVVT